MWRVPPSRCASWFPSSRPLRQCGGPCPLLYPVLVVLRWFLAPVLWCPLCPVPVGACLSPWASPRPLAAGLPFALSLSGVLAVGWWRGLWDANGPCLGSAGLEPPAESFGGVGAAEALNRVPEEGFPCSLRHGGLRSGVVGVGGGAGENFLESLEGVAPFTPSRSPGLLHPAAELPQAGADHQGRWRGGGSGGEGSDLEVLEWRWRGLKVGDVYGSHGEREARCRSWGEGDPDMGRRWVVLWLVVVVVVLQVVAGALVALVVMVGLLVVVVLWDALRIPWRSGGACGSGIVS